MGTTTIILCRHGESEGNRERRFGGHSPTPLTDLGRAQARAAGELLARDGVDWLYTSDLPRAEETAALIAEATGVVPCSTPALRERSVGELTGLTFAEAEARFPHAFGALLRREPAVCPPGGESYDQCRQRAAEFLTRVLSEHASKRVVLVSHHITAYQMVLHILALACSTSAPRVSFQLDNCALHRFEYLESGEWRVHGLNERGHLDALARRIA